MKRGGRVIILVATGMKAKERKEIDRNVELIQLEIQEEGRRKLNFASYMPPRTDSLDPVKYEHLWVKSEDELHKVFQREGKLIATGDFNCREIDWECMDVHSNEESFNCSENDDESRDRCSNGGSCDTNLLELVTATMITQHLKDVTRVRGNDKPSRHNLVFMRDPTEVEDITYKCPLGRSDHMVLEFEMVMKHVRQEPTGWKDIILPKQILIHLGTTSLALSGVN